MFAPLILLFHSQLLTRLMKDKFFKCSYREDRILRIYYRFFEIIVMFMFLISGEWRRHVFILAYTVGYLIVLVMSPFAQSGRFHMPIWPMLMLFAAYGVQIAKSNGKLKRWLPMVLVLEVAICIAWNWFKLKGRGMI